MCMLVLSVFTVPPGERGFGTARGGVATFMDLSELSGSEFDSYSDDGCLFIDESSGRAAVTPFEALTAGSEDGGDYGDVEYETQTRQSLHALLEQADAELYNEGGGSSADTECRRWRRGFCHLAVHGHAAAAPVAAAHASAAVDPVSSSSRVADYCVLTVAHDTASLELELVGRQCVPTPPHAEHEWDAAPPAHVEEVLAWHGVHEETLAAHVTGGPDAAAAGRREWSRLRRFGLPPREPGLVLVESVLSRLVQACWRALQPALAKVPLVTARVLARLAMPLRAESQPPTVAPATAAPCQAPSSPAPPPPSGSSWASAQWSPLAPERALAVAAAYEPPLGTCAAVALGGLRQTFAVPQGSRCGSCTSGRSNMVATPPPAGLRPRVLPPPPPAARAVPSAARLPRGGAAPWSAQDDVARRMMPASSVGSRCSRPASSAAGAHGVGAGGGGSGGGGGGATSACSQQGQPAPRAARINSLAPTKRFSPSVGRRASSGSTKPSTIDDGLRLPPITLFGRGYSS